MRQEFWAPEKWTAPIIADIYQQLAAIEPLHGGDWKSWHRRNRAAFDRMCDDIACTMNAKGLDVTAENVRHQIRYAVADIPNAASHPNTWGFWHHHIVHKAIAVRAGWLPKSILETAAISLGTATIKKGN